MFEIIDENIDLFKTLTKEQKNKYIDYIVMMDKFKSNTVEYP
jgi:hypothetical protein